MAQDRVLHSDTIEADCLSIHIVAGKPTHVGKVRRLQNEKLTCGLIAISGGSLFDARESGSGPRFRYCGMDAVESWEDIGINAIKGEGIANLKDDVHDQ